MDPTQSFKRHLFGVTVLIIIVGGCSMTHDQSMSAADERVTVNRDGEALVIANHTAAPIWTFSAGQKALTTMLWAPQLEDTPIAPGDSARVAIGNIPRQGDERDIVVHWWQAITENGERVPGAIQSVRVAL